MNAVVSCNCSKIVAMDKKLRGKDRGSGRSCQQNPDFGRHRKSGCLPV
jgi:hypothetical protein